MPREEAGGKESISLGRSFATSMAIALNLKAGHSALQGSCKIKDSRSSASDRVIVLYHQFICPLPLNTHRVCIPPHGKGHISFTSTAAVLANAMFF